MLGNNSVFHFNSAAREMGGFKVPEIITWRNDIVTRAVTEALNVARFDVDLPPQTQTDLAPVHDINSAPSKQAATAAAIAVEQTKAETNHTILDEPEMTDNVTYLNTLQNDDAERQAAARAVVAEAFKKVL